MRGKGSAIVFSSLALGITPAYAGKRSTIQQPRQPAQDHPRLCGEKVYGSVIRHDRIGSPPPMRGKASTTKRSQRDFGITPAYAGKRRSPALLPELEQDHPRLCGEKCTIVERKSLRVGSPPPMRGKGVQIVRSFCVSRITPAYAGKSSRPQKFTELTGDHPRLCGEKVMVRIPEGTNIGITPAYAGKRFRGQRRSKVYKDHPRLCGEKRSSVS